MNAKLSSSTMVVALLLLSTLVILTGAHESSGPVNRSPAESQALKISSTATPATIAWTGGGNDQIYGDDGNDFISDGNDTDSVHGGFGDDTLFSGVDSTVPGPVFEFLDGGDGCDVL